MNDRRKEAVSDRIAKMLFVFAIAIFFIFYGVMIQKKSLFPTDSSPKVSRRVAFDASSVMIYQVTEDPPIRS